MAETRESSQYRFARQKLAGEIRLKRADQSLALRQHQLAVEQFEFQKKQSSHSSFGGLLSPQGVVLAGAALGLIGTALSTNASQQTTRRQQETEVILKASEVPASLAPDEQAKQRALNLLWFSETNYISLPKPFVDNLRRIAGVTQGQALPSPVVESTTPQAITDALRAPPGKAGTKLVAALVGFQPAPYHDSSGTFDIGFGHMISAEEAENRYKGGITREEAMTLLDQDLQPSRDYIDKVVKVKLSPDQKDALVALVWNIGPFNFGHSTLLSRLNAGDYKSVAQEFSKWNHRNGAPLPGLTIAREAEAKLWARDAPPP